jgi:hypothetical protein
MILIMRKTIKYNFTRGHVKQKNGELQFVKLMMLSSWSMEIIIHDSMCDG